MSRFLNSSTSQISDEVYKKIIAELISPSGKIYSNLIPTTTQTALEVYNVVNYAAVLALNVPENSFAITSSGEIYLYDVPSGWKLVNLLNIGLSNLGDISFNNPQNYQTIAYNSTSSKFENRKLDFNGLYFNNILILSPSQYDVILWNNVDKFINDRITMQYMGDVVFSSIQTGQYLRYVSGAWRNSNPDSIDLNTLTNCIVVAPINKQFLMYDTTASLNKFKNISISLLNGHISDINVSGQANGNFLKYNGTTWVPSSISTLNISNFSTSGASLNDWLHYNGTNWINKKILLNDLDDIDNSNANVNKDVLIYDSSQSKYITRNLIINDISSFNSNAPAQKNYLRYNGTQYVNANILLSDITNVDPLIDTSVADYEFMIYNVNQWTSQAVIPRPTTLANSIIRSNGTSYSLISNTLNNHNDVSLTVPQEYDILQYDVLSSNWVNEPRYKGILNITVSRDFTSVDITKILLYTGAYNTDINLQLTSACNNASVAGVHEIEIYNTNGANLTLSSVSPIIILSNMTHIVCGKYSKLSKIESNTWIFNSDIYNHSIIKLSPPLTISNSVFQNLGMYNNAYLYVYNAFKKILINYKSATGSSRSYKTYNLITMAPINLIDVVSINTNVSSATPSITIDNLTFFNLEYNAGNIILVRTADFYSTLNYTTLLSGVNNVCCKNILYSYSAAKFIVPYYDVTTSTILFRGFLYSGSATNIASPNPAINIANVNDVIGGYHKSYGILLFKTTTTLYMVVSDTPNDYPKNMNSDRFYSFSNTDTALHYIYESSEDTNQDMFFFTATSSNIRIYTINNYKTAPIELINISQSSSYRDAIKIGNYIYFSLSTPYTQPKIIKFNIYDQSTVISFNEYDVNKTVSLIGTNGRSLMQLRLNENTLEPFTYRERANIF